MDGTLLTTKKDIDQMTVNTIKKMRKNDIDFTIATGRLYPVVLNTVDTLEIKKPLILCNGAIVQDPVTEEVYYSKQLDKNHLEELTEIIKKSGCYYYFYTKDSLYTEELKYTAKYYFEQNKKIGKTDRPKMKINIIKSISQILDKPVYKVVLVDENPDKINFVRESLKSYSDSFNYVSSASNNLEIVSSEASKGRAVRFLKEMLGYKNENVMCIGDEENDESMIREGGFSVAMGNASEHIKSIADYITDDNDNQGVSKAIEEFSRR